MARYQSLNFILVRDYTNVDLWIYFNLNYDYFYRFIMLRYTNTKPKIVRKKSRPGLK